MKELKTIRSTRIKTMKCLLWCVNKGQCWKPNFNHLLVCRWPIGDKWLKHWNWGIQVEDGIWIWNDRTRKSFLLPKNEIYLNTKRLNPSSSQVWCRGSVMGQSYRPQTTNWKVAYSFQNLSSHKKYTFGDYKGS